MHLMYDQSVPSIYFSSDMLIQPPEWSEAISNASEKMLENNGHFLRAKIVIEQQAIEIARLQEALDTQNKANHNLNVQVTTLKYVWPFHFFLRYMRHLSLVVTPSRSLRTTVRLAVAPMVVYKRLSDPVVSPTSRQPGSVRTFPTSLYGRGRITDALWLTPSEGIRTAMQLPCGARQSAGDLARVLKTTKTARRRTFIWRMRMVRLSLQLKLQR